MAPSMTTRTRYLSTSTFDPLVLSFMYRVIVHRLRLLNIPTRKALDPMAAERIATKPPESKDQSRARAQKYYEKMKPGPNGKPGGYDNFDDFLWMYLAPYALKRLEALDRYSAAHPPKKSTKKSSKKGTSK